MRLILLLKDVRRWINAINPHEIRVREFTEGRDLANQQLNGCIELADPDFASDEESELSSEESSSTSSGSSESVSSVSSSEWSDGDWIAQLRAENAQLRAENTVLMNRIESATLEIMRAQTGVTTADSSVKNALNLLQQ